MKDKIESIIDFLTESDGEVSKDMNEDKPYKIEVAQVAAVCLRMLANG